MPCLEHECWHAAVNGSNVDVKFWVKLFKFWATAVVSSLCLLSLLEDDKKMKDVRSEQCGRGTK